MDATDRENALALPPSKRGWSGLLLPGLFVAGLIGLSLVRFPSAGGANRNGGLQPANTRQIVADLTGRDLNGNLWSLRDQKNKVVLVNYWATWCPPCRQETPGLVNVAKRYAGRGLSVVGVSLDTGGSAATGAVRDFARRYAVPYPLILAEENPAMVTPSIAAVQAIPTTLLLDRQGRVAKTIMGAVDEAALRTDIETLLAESDRAAGKEQRQSDVSRGF